MIRTLSLCISVRNRLIHPSRAVVDVIIKRGTERDDINVAFMPPVTQLVVTKLRAVRDMLGEFWTHIAFFGLLRLGGITL